MVANWMDFIKSERSYDSLKPYHYCTILHPDSMDTHKHPAEGDIWMAIDKFLTEIETGQYSVDEGFALRAIAHLIGDVHQPLHCGRGTDMGGNMVQVKWFTANPTYTGFGTKRRLLEDELHGVPDWAMAKVNKNETKKKPLVIIHILVALYQAIPWEILANGVPLHYDNTAAHQRLPVGTKQCSNKAYAAHLISFTATIMIDNYICAPMSKKQINVTRNGENVWTRKAHETQFRTVSRRGFCSCVAVDLLLQLPFPQTRPREDACPNLFHIAILLAYNHFIAGPLNCFDACLAKVFSSAAGL